jgi:PAS domain S-box-containing protein
MGKNSKKNDLLNEIKSLDSKEFYQTLFKYAPDAYYINDLEGHFLDGNKVAEEITGYQNKELVGKNFFELDLLEKKDIPKAKETIKQNKKGLSTGPDEFTLYRKDNKKIAVEIFTYPLIIKDKPLVLAIARDITERKKAQESYRAVFENTGTATVIIEKDMAISLANTQFEKFSGFSRQEIENRKKWTEFVLPEDLPKMKTYHQDRRTGGKLPTEYEFRSIDKHGQVKDIYLRIGLIPGTKKTVASLTDITRIKQIEAELKASEEKYKTITEGSADAIFITDQKGDYVYVNQAVTDLLGYS